MSAPFGFDPCLWAFAQLVSTVQAIQASATANNPTAQQLASYQAAIDAAVAATPSSAISTAPPTGA